MKHILAFILAVSAFAQQNVPVGRMALRPADSAAIDAYLYSAENLNPQGGATTITTAIDAVQTSITLPASVAATCSWTYPVTTLTVTGNVATATVETYPAYLVSGSATSMPVGTRFTLSNALTGSFNATFTSSALQTQNQLTFAITQANGTYTNTSIDTNDFILLTYARCAVLVDNEVISIIGTADGANYFAVRGELGTTAAAHAVGAMMTPLRYPDKRHWYRSLITNATGDIFNAGKATTTKYTQLMQALTDAQAALSQARGKAAR